VPNTLRPIRPPQSCANCPVRKSTTYSPLIESDPDKIMTLRHDIVTVPARRIILRAGETPTKIYTLYDGWCFRFILLPDGRRQILSFLMPGDLISAQALYIQPMRFSVQTVTDATLCAFDLKELSDAMRLNQELYVRITTRFMREFAEADERVLGLGRLSAMERIARLVLRLTNRLKLRGLMSGDSTEFPLRQEHIADALGLTAVHVSRMLSTLRDEGVIAIERNMLKIADRSRLIELAGNYEALALT
jgi:CRP-like cAMP-binding protein